MQEKIYTNEELAKDFLRVATVQAEGFTQYISISKKIREYEEDIQKRYGREKNLEFISKKIKHGQSMRILRMILENGIKKAEEEIISEKESQLRNRATIPRNHFNIRQSRTGRVDDDDFNFERAIKNYEKY